MSYYCVIEDTIVPDSVKQISTLKCQLNNILYNLQTEAVVMKMCITLFKFDNV